MYDIIIVGCGPAGATLARLLRRDYRILVVERRDLTTPWQRGMYRKCCGGLLAPDAQRVLAEQDLHLPLCVLESPQIFAVQSVDLACGLERFYQRFYININREAFDRHLASLLPSNCELRCNAFVTAADTVTGTVCFRSGGKEYSEHGRMIIGADGAHSLVRRLAGAECHSSDRYIAIQEEYEIPVPRSFFSAFFDPASSDFYGWIVPKQTGCLLGLALRPGPDAQNKFEHFKTRVENFQGFKFAHRICREGTFIVRPRRMSTLLSAHQGVCFVGEAGGWISPSSAEGISYALRSAAYLAKHLNSIPLDRKPHPSFPALTANIFLKNLKSPFMYFSPLRRTIMHSGITALDHPAAGK